MLALCWQEEFMATLTVRNVPIKVVKSLKTLARRNRRSMEQEARETLRSALSAPSPPKGNLAEIIRRRFAPFGGVDLELPPREPVREPPDFGE